MTRLNKLFKLSELSSSGSASFSSPNAMIISTPSTPASKVPLIAPSPQGFPGENKYSQHSFLFFTLTNQVGC
jgi:hypothetical protein